MYLFSKAALQVLYRLQLDADQGLSWGIGNLNAGSTWDSHQAHYMPRVGAMVEEGIRVAGVSAVAEGAEKGRAPVPKRECVGPEDFP